MKQAVCGYRVRRTGWTSRVSWLLVALAAACGGKRSGVAQTTDRASDSAPPAPGKLDAGTASAAPTRADASAGSTPKDAGARDASLAADASSSNPTLPVVDASASSSPPSDTLDAGAPALTTAPVLTTAPPVVTEPAITTPPTPTAPDPPEPAPSIDWSDLEAPEGCQITTGSGTDDDTCALQLECDGVQTANATCHAGECYCYYPTAAWSVTVEGADLLDVCEATLDFCQPPTLEEVENSDCVSNYGWGEDYACSRVLECVRTQDYESGVTATWNSVESVECSAAPGVVVDEQEQWQCLCVRNGTSYATFYTPGLNPTLDVCTQAQDLCLRVHALQPASGTCEVSSEYFGEDSCSSTATCLIAGSIDGARVYTNDDLLVNCTSSGEADLSCTVDGPLGLSTLIVPKPQPALDACRNLTADVQAQLQSAGPPVEPPVEPPLLDAGSSAVADGG